jgi:hypothetical protein
VFTLAFSRDSETSILDFTRTHFTIVALSIQSCSSSPSKSKIGPSAFVSDPWQTVLTNAHRKLTEMQRRDPEGIKTRVALTDGERALQILVEGTGRHSDPGSAARSGETLESR